MMKLTDILSLFREGKGTVRSHMKNLIEMAVVDGNFVDAENSLLKSIASRNGISERQLKDIQKNPDHVVFEVPTDKREKFHQLYDLVYMMVVDKNIHEEEKKLSNIYAVKFGYKRERVKELVDSIKSNIENGQDHDETMRRVEWMLN